MKWKDEIKRYSYANASEYPRRSWRSCSWIVNGGGHLWLNGNRIGKWSQNSRIEIELELIF